VFEGIGLRVIDAILNIVFMVARAAAAECLRAHTREMCSWAALGPARLTGAPPHRCARQRGRSAA
jgi:hypothetical protein